MIGEHLEWPRVRCCMGDEGHCVCPPMERAMRGWARMADMPPMTAGQRECCLDEVGRVEGCARSGHEAATDAQLARDTLSAWADYARDKGLM